MRTASAGGKLPSSRKRRTLLYAAVSTSTEKVERASSATCLNAFSSITA